MGIVTLLTDWGEGSPQLAAIKGNILHELPVTVFVDISHRLPKFNLVEASYIFRQTYKHFPANTVHYIGLEEGNIDPATGNKQYLIIKNEGQLFIGPDSGFFSMVFESIPQDMVRINIENSTYRYHYNLDLVKYICSLLSHPDIEDLGEHCESIVERELWKPIIEQNKIIRGSIIHVDSFGNVVTNVKRPFFEKVRAGRNFSIALRKSEYHITSIHDWYDGVARDEIVAMFNAADHLEIALNQSNASGLIGLDVNDKIRIDFNDN